MAGDEGVARWIVEKLTSDREFRSVASVGSGFLELTPMDASPFIAVAIGIKDLIRRNDVSPLFEVRDNPPEFVVNVPSKAVWSGPAIDCIHAAPAAFGTFGELIRASREEPVSSYRHREYGFFERAFQQHSAINGITRLYDKVFKLHRRRDMSDIIVTLIDAYDMSAEDIRRARDLYGRYDAAVKISSYGSITTAALSAAASIGAEAFTFRQLMGRLNRP